MSFMFELYYSPPADPGKETQVTERVCALGGRFDYREEAGAEGRSGICLTYEFDTWEQAEQAAAALRRQGEHVEGPVDYGP